jgi:AcrR family transcriptional regulator
VTAVVESLQGRRRRYVAAEISRAAMRLFAERGFDAVTVDEIAESAGMSARTFFRYFASKDDVVLQYRRRLDDRLVDTVAARPPEEGAVTALRNAFLTTSTVPPEDRDLVALRSRVLFEAPALRGRAHAEQTTSSGPLVRALADRMGVDPAVDDRPQILAVAMAAVASLAFEAWVLDGGRDDPADRIGDALATLERGLAELDGIRPAKRVRSA